PTRKPTRFSLAPDAKACADIAAELGISAVTALQLQGELRPSGNRDWVLAADLAAVVEQPCILTLAPVRTQIDEPVSRRYVAGLHPPEAEEAEMPEDDSVEPLPSVIDLGAVMIEALALSLPLYPRAEGATLDQSTFSESGSTPLTDEALRPFADLANILKKGTPKQ
ncbi:MAG: DUF177 domain-containing protein, partial [Albidovulum sp.]